MTYYVGPSLVNGRAPSRAVHTALVNVLGVCPLDSLRASPKARANRYECVSAGGVVTIGDVDPPTIGEIEHHVSVSDGELVEPVSITNGFTIVESCTRCWECTRPGLLAIF